MIKKVKSSSFILILLIILFTISLLPNFSHNEYNYDGEVQNPQYSASLEGADNIIVTDIIRTANITGYGLVSFEDMISFKNLNENPINSIFISIHSNISDELVYFDAKGIDDNTLLTERSYLIMGEYEMIAVYFDSPLLPQQTKTIIFNQHFNNLLWYHIDYSPENDLQHFINYRGFVFPTLPYKAERKMVAIFNVDERPGSLDGGWGFEQINLDFVKYDIEYIKDSVKGSYITPFLENLNENRIINISYYQNNFVNLELEEINRDIFISPWGIIRVSEELNIRNRGIIGLENLILDIPKAARDVYVSDDIGEILGLRITEQGATKELRISLLTNRVRLIPNSSFTFSVRYYLPFENYFSVNWVQESINLDIFSTSYGYIGKQLSIRLIIDGCSSIDYISELPKAITKSQGTTTLFYTFDYVFPVQAKLIQFTFTIDFFDLLLRPILIILIISLIASIYVLVIKTRKKEYGAPLITREFIPVNEIREFCSLYEEKNALMLEMRQAEEDAKRKKIAKKNFKNIINKNSTKVDEIQQELTPFKKILSESGEVFENIIKKLDVLEAERISIKDSLNLLESRYKRGRLPSRAAYMKLSDDFKKRMKKIDRTIDKFLQQLRSYLL
ncbi:MAG: hypothetical protein ACFFE4_06925 [Candidatus Thorarchaeota archaeon]